VSTKVLIAEDEQTIREELVECLTNQGFECIEALNGKEGLETLSLDTNITIALCDIIMPQKSGLEMISEAQPLVDKGRNLEFIILTGHGGSKEAIDALKLGAIDFLEKPIDPDHLLHVIRRAEELVLLKQTSCLYEAHLKAKTQAIEKRLISLDNSNEASSEGLNDSTKFKSIETANHIRRIGGYVQIIAKELGWSKDRLNAMLLAAPLYDVNNTSGADSSLLQSDKLESDERLSINENAPNRLDVLSYSNHPVMQISARIAKNHHERWDGSGFPLGLKGSDIPIEARIMTLVDAYDALRSKRSYKPAFNQEKTLSILFNGDGRTDPLHFDPELINILRRMPDKFDEIYLKLAD